MIRINLLKPLQLEAAPIFLHEPENKGKKWILVGGGLALVLVSAIVFLQYPSLLGDLMSKPKEASIIPVSEAPQSLSLDTLKPKPITANAVEETVRDIGDQSERQAKAPTYADLVPSEKIEFQYFASTRILKEIKAVTPPDVGFADFIFTPPGDFYIHGLANDEESYQKFSHGLARIENCQVRPGLEGKASAKGLSKEFSFYGTINYPLLGVPVPPDHVIPKAKLAQELAQFKEIASKLGIKIKEPKMLTSTDLGTIKRQIYQTFADCNFQQMQDFLEALQEAKCHFGILKFSLQAKGNEKIVAEVALLAYVN
jgi:hypothetical protein